MEPRPRRVMAAPVQAMTLRRVRKRRLPVMMPRVLLRVPRQVPVPWVLAGEALAGLPQARAAEVAQEAACAMRRPPARVCRSSI